LDISLDWFAIFIGLFLYDDSNQFLFVHFYNNWISIWIGILKLGCYWLDSIGDRFGWNLVGFEMGWAWKWMVYGKVRNGKKMGCLVF
jgi:hypothetical protein